MLDCIEIASMFVRITHARMLQPVKINSICYLFLQFFSLAFLRKKGKQESHFRIPSSFKFYVRQVLDFLFVFVFGTEVHYLAVVYWDLEKKNFVLRYLSSFFQHSRPNILDSQTNVAPSFLLLQRLLQNISYIIIR